MSELAELRKALSVQQAAAAVSVHPQLIYLAVNRGELKAKRISGRKPGIPGKAIRITVDDLQEWFDGLEDVVPQVKASP